MICMASVVQGYSHTAISYQHLWVDVHLIHGYSHTHRNLISTPLCLGRCVLTHINTSFYLGRCEQAGTGITASGHTQHGAAQATQCMQCMGTHTHQHLFNLGRRAAQAPLACWHRPHKCWVLSTRAPTHTRAHTQHAHTHTHTPIQRCTSVHVHHTHTHTHTHTNTEMHICTCTSHTHTHTHTNTEMHICTCTSLTHTHTPIQRCTSVHVHHTHTHTHTPIQRCTSVHVHRCTCTDVP